MVLILLTAFKYRRQIRSLLEVSKMLREAKQQVEVLSRTEKEKTAGVQLVQCSRCDVWIPKNRALNVGGVELCDKCSS